MPVETIGVICDSTADFPRGVAYADNLSEALRFSERLAELTGRPEESIKLVEIGATISVHTGPRAIGVAVAPRLKRRP